MGAKARPAPVMTRITLVLGRTSAAGQPREYVAVATKFLSKERTNSGIEVCHTEEVAEATVERSCRVLRKGSDQKQQKPMLLGFDAAENDVILGRSRWAGK